MKIDRVIKNTFWGHIIVDILIVLFYSNIFQDCLKKEDAYGDSYSWVGWGAWAFILSFFIIYTIVFIIWLRRLYLNRDTIKLQSKILQLFIISIFSIIPALLLIIFLMNNSPFPFENYSGPESIESLDIRK